MNHGTGLTAISLHLPDEVMVAYSPSAPEAAKARLHKAHPDATEMLLPDGVDYCLRLGGTVSELAPLMQAGGRGAVLLRSADPTLMLIGRRPEAD